MRKKEARGSFREEVSLAQEKGAPPALGRHSPSSSQQNAFVQGTSWTRLLEWKRTVLVEAQHLLGLNSVFRDLPRAGLWRKLWVDTTGSLCLGLGGLAR